MIYRAFLALALAFACLLPAPMLAQANNTADQSPEGIWRSHLQTWRTQRDHEISAPDGWLALVGLEWLKPGFNSFGSAADNQVRIHANAPDHIGLLTVSHDTVQLLAPRGGFPAELMVDGHPAREETLDTGDTKPSMIAWHGLDLVVQRRGDRFALRIKDADSPARTGFKGLYWYAPDLRYAVEAHWTPYNPPHHLKIATVIGTTLDLPSPGVAEFTLDGKTLRLEPVLEDPHATTLFFILRDATSQSTTYGGGRFLHTGFPDHGLSQPGTLILDFNQLFNPPCAYTSYATCPLPPDQNRLPVAIEAGEQRYTP